MANPLSSTAATYSPFSPPSSGTLNARSRLTQPASSSMATIRPHQQPTPLSPTRSTLLLPQRTNSRPSSLAGSSRPPTSPPANSNGIAPKRFPSPVLRARSVLGSSAPNLNNPTLRRNSNTNNTPHPQQHLQQTSRQPTGPTAEELEIFSEICRALYYEKDPEAAYAVEATLAKLPPSHRTAYARTMANVRSQFHKDQSLRSSRMVKEILDSTISGMGIRTALKISKGGVVSMRSSLARQQRKEMLKQFLKGHADKNLVGTIPFLKSLYKVLELQTHGEVGRKRVEWEVDESVFTEAAGGEWAADSIVLLKAFLGFEERSVETRPESSFYEEESIPIETTIGLEQNLLQMDEDAIEEESDDDSEDEEDEEDKAATSKTAIVKTKRSPPQVPPHRRSSSAANTPATSTPNFSSTSSTPNSTTSSPSASLPSSPPSTTVDSFSTRITNGTNSNRTRAPSDPFLDPGERRLDIKGILIDTNPLSSPKLGQGEFDSPVIASMPTHAKGITRTVPIASPPLPARPDRATTTTTTTTALDDASLLDDGPQYRIFTTASYLTDPELDSLARLFPDFITASAKIEKKDKKSKTSTERVMEEARGMNHGGGGGSGGGEVASIASTSFSRNRSQGHGEIRIGEMMRDEGWKGTGWQRFCFWWRKAFRRHR